jgi:hypothetical protein
MNHENIYDSKINEVRPQINKSLGKHQINNNLHLYAKARNNQPFLGGRPPISAVQPGNSKRIQEEAKIIAYNHSSAAIPR